MTDSGLWEHIEKLVAESHYVIIAMIIIILIILLIDKRFKNMIKNMFNHIFTSMDRHREVINIFINALGLIGIIIAILSYNADIKKRHEDNEIIRKQTTLKNILELLFHYKTIS